MPGCTHRSASHAHGMIVVGKDLFDGIPFQLTPQQEGDVGQVTDGGDAMPDLNGEVRVLAGFDTVEEIAVLAPRAGEELRLIGTDDRVEDLGV